MAGTNLQPPLWKKTHLVGAPGAEAGHISITSIGEPSFRTPSHSPFAWFVETHRSRSAVLTLSAPSLCTAVSPLSIFFLRFFDFFRNITVRSSSGIPVTGLNGEPRYHVTRKFGEITYHAIVEAKKGKRRMVPVTMWKRKE